MLSMENLTSKEVVWGIKETSTLNVNHGNKLKTNFANAMETLE